MRSNSPRYDGGKRLGGIKPEFGSIGNVNAVRSESGEGLDVLTGVRPDQECSYLAVQAAGATAPSRPTSPRSRRSRSEGAGACGYRSRRAPPSRWWFRVSGSSGYVASCPPRKVE